MTHLMQNFYQKFHMMLDKYPEADERVKNWWLIGSPGPIITILASYLFFCNYAGPLYMRNKKPYNLKHIITIYNLAQIAMNGYLVILALKFLGVRDYRNNFGCLNIDYSNTPNGINEAYLVWIYFFIKVTELLETVFFVLRKKNNQVSFLHLYHHTVMLSLAWFSTKYYAGGQCVVDGSLNSLVHVLMYTYYALSALGPKYQKYLWWKKYLTFFQLIQFSIVTSLNVDCLLNNNGNYPIFINLFVMSNCIIFFYMFGKFFYQNYINKNQVDKLQ